MKRRFDIRALGAILLLGVLAGCAYPQPFILIDQEFDRSREDFGRKPSDIAGVTICYNAKGTTPRRLLDVAAKACGEYGKVPVLSNADRNWDCPLLQPASVNYACQVPVASGYYRN